MVKILLISKNYYICFNKRKERNNFIKKYESNILSVESKKEDLKQSTDNFLCFFDKMYSIWENKINSFRLEYGYFLINPNDDFFKSYKKLKKYIKH